MRNRYCAKSSTPIVTDSRRLIIRSNSAGLSCGRRIWKDPQVFSAGDLLRHSVEGHPKIRVEPDVLVAFERPKGDRESYRQCEEGEIAPTAVFEVLSPGNCLTEMAKKLQFYDRYGVEEYYIYDPDCYELTEFQRLDGKLTVLDNMTDCVSPRLGIRFVLRPDDLEVYYPDGRRFLTTIELTQQMAQEKQRAERLAAQVRALGVEPD